MINSGSRVKYAATSCVKYKLTCLYTQRIFLEREKSDSIDCLWEGVGRIYHHFVHLHFKHYEFVIYQDKNENLD